MKTETIHVDNRGNGINEVLKQSEETALHYGLDPRTSMQLRLLTEETLEMVRNIAGDFEADFYIEGSRRGCELRFKAETRMDSKKRERLISAFGKDSKKSGLAGKIGRILDSRYSDFEEISKELEETGILRTDPALFEDLEHRDNEEGYVWSLQSYEMSVFDKTVSRDITDEDWAEISHSIIANLADDIRIYIFRDRVEIAVLKDFEKQSADSLQDYEIDPEFEKLKKVPVVTSKLQIHLVQLMYKKLPGKEKSTDTLNVSMEKLPVPSSPKDRLNTMIYTPKALADKESPCVLLLHGGAFVFPALPYHYRLARIIAEEVGCRVFMPLYDLAPAYVPPLQQEEAFSVYCYLRNNAKTLKINPEKIALMGDSAGGTLCAALILMLRDRGVPLPASQSLLYPSLDSRFNSESMKKYTDVPVCNAKAVHKYQELCKSDIPRNREYISPLEAESLEGIPATYVETAEFDCLHDDGIAYANRLIKEGSEVVLNETKGTVHAFDMAMESSILKQAMEKRIDFLKKVL